MTMPPAPALQAYAAARQAVLDAQALDDHEAARRAALESAYERLQVAEAAVRPELDRAWQANIDAVQTAKANLDAAVLNQAAVENACGAAARQRNPVYPVLNDAEINQVQTAQAAADAAREAIVDAKRTFKAGVTVEQLEAVT